MIQHVLSNTVLRKKTNSIQLLSPIQHVLLKNNNNDSGIAFDTKDNTACDNNECASCDVGTLRCAHYDINTIRCGNNNTLPFYLPWKQVLFRVYDIKIIIMILFVV